MSKPDFSHLSLQDKNCTAFHKYMESKGYQLGDALYEYGKTWKSWGTCIVCEVDFPANVASHVWGKAHCNKLKEKLNWQEPRDPQQLNQFTQFWKLEGYYKPGYFFNHITGEQGLCDFAPPDAPASIQSVPTPMSVAAPMPGPPQMQCPAAAPQEMPATRPAGGCLLVPHSQGYIKSIQALELWRMHMDKTGSALDGELEKTGRYDHECIVCQKAMTRGAGDHLKSKNHWAELWKKVGKNMPQPDLVLEKGKPWWQEFVVPQGKCILNHLTGGLEIAGAEPAGYASGCNGAANGAVSMPATPAAAPVQPESEPGAPPSQPLSPSADAAGMIVPHGTTWRQALSESKDKWRTFMEPAATVLEQKVPNSYECMCTVCDNKVMTRGAKDHLTSQGHWKNLWDKMQKLNRDLPPDNVACQMTARPWVQEFPTASGKYVFNHLTAGQMLQGGSALLQPLQPQGQAPAMPAPPMPPVPAVPVQSPQMQPQQMQAPPQPMQPVQPVQPAQPAVPMQPRMQEGGMVVRNGLNYKEALAEIGKWKKFMAEPTERLDSFIYQLMPNYTGKCLVCQADMLGFNTHICSQKHFKQLWARIGSKGIPDPSTVMDWNAAWVEKIETQRGPYLLNHLTGEQGFQADLLKAPAGPSPVAAPATHAAPDAGYSRPPAPTPGPVAQPLPQPCAAPTPATSYNMDFLLWQCQVRDPAERLEEALEERGEEDMWNDPVLECAICQKSIDSAKGSVKAHLMSLEHFQQLKGKLHQELTRLGSMELVMQQKHKFCQNFDVAAFQHLKPEVIYQ
ncbi:unnamed protein product [Symbiodinium sp. CCMP2592]|nr:unnamed protein product [Symbiodinium sp. CCMP2592]